MELIVLGHGMLECWNTECGGGGAYFHQIFKIIFLYRNYILMFINLKLLEALEAVWRSLEDEKSTLSD